MLTYEEQFQNVLDILWFISSEVSVICQSIFSLFLNIYSRVSSVICLKETKKAAYVNLT